MQVFTIRVAGTIAFRSPPQKQIDLRFIDNHTLRDTGILVCRRVYGGMNGKQQQQQKKKVRELHAQMCLIFANVLDRKADRGDYSLFGTKLLSDAILLTKRFVLFLGVTVCHL